VDPQSMALRAAEVESITAADNVQLVAVTAASNAIGLEPDISALASLARDHGAVFVVDGVHATPHTTIDVGAMGADIFFCSAYKFYGPHIGIAAVRHEL